MSTESIAVTENPLVVRHMDGRRFQAAFILLFLFVALVLGDWLSVRMLEQQKHQFSLLQSSHENMTALLGALDEADASAALSTSGTGRTQILGTRLDQADASVALSTRVAASLWAARLENQLETLRIEFPAFSKGEFPVKLIFLQQQLRDWSMETGLPASARSRAALQDLLLLLERQKVQLRRAEFGALLFWLLPTFFLLLVVVLVLWRPAGSLLQHLPFLRTEVPGADLGTSSHVKLILHCLESLSVGLASLDEKEEEPAASREFYALLLSHVESVTGASGSILYQISEENTYTPLVVSGSARFSSKNVKGMVACKGSQSCVPCQSFDRLQQYSWVCIGLEDVKDQTNSARSCLLLQMPAVALTWQQKQFLSQVAQIVSSILYGEQRVRRSKRLVQYQERSMIAQELHDSLAQSLSYLKIQVTRLSSLTRTVPPEKLNYADDMIQELRTALDISYRQLRELITTFRLTTNGRTLELALEDSVEEFENRSGIAFHLDNRLPRDKLSASSEIQVLQIARGAIANVVQHSGARRCDVSLSQNDEAILLLIDDDGCGRVQENWQFNKHGLKIMRERAEQLKGELHVEASPLGGVRVRLESPMHNSRKGA